MSKQCPNAQPSSNPHHLLRQILEQFGQAYIEQHNPTQPQRKLLFDVIKCGTEAMGRGYEQFCSRCQETHTVYHRCNNRHCPFCQWVQKKRRVKALKAKLPLCSYSLVTVMPPLALYPIINGNRKFWYDLLMKLPADAIKEFANDAKYGAKYLGGLPAIYAVLQTNNVTMDDHPHSHSIVSNGGERDNEWVEPRNPHWIPTDQMSQRVKELILAHVRKNKRLWNPDTFQYIEKCIQKGHWEVHCSPYGNELTYDQDENGNDKYDLDHAANLTKLLKYVGHDCMASHRIIAIDDETVTIKYKERNQEQWEQETLPGVEYIRRFMQHVLPPRFNSIRSYGLLHSSKKAKLQKAKKLFEKHRQVSGCFMGEWLHHGEQVIQDQQEQQEQSGEQFGGCCTYCGTRTLKATRIFFQNPMQRKNYFTHGSRASPDIPNL